MFNVGFVHTADLDGVVGLNPPRKTAEFPFGTDIRTGADNCHKTCFFGFVQKGFNVKLAGKIEFARLWLVQIPRAIGFHTVAAESGELCKDIRPGVGHIAKVVNSTGNKLYRFAVLIKIVFFDFKCHKIPSKMIFISIAQSCRRFKRFYMSKKRWHKTSGFFTKALDKTRGI